LKNIVQKVVIYSMVGMMQIGIGASVIEASPLSNDGPQRIVQLDNRNHHNDERQREHDRRLRQENERHEREMRRHHHESEREWHERQERENQRHRNALNEIASFLIGIVIGASSN
jgi:hypothetical protein